MCQFTNQEFTLEYRNRKEPIIAYKILIKRPSLPMFEHRRKKSYITFRLASPYILKNFFWDLKKKYMKPRWTFDGFVERIRNRFRKDYVPSIVGKDALHFYLNYDRVQHFVMQDHEVLKVEIQPQDVIGVGTVNFAPGVKKAYSITATKAKLLPTSTQLELYGR